MARLTDCGGMGNEVASTVFGFPKSRPRPLSDGAAAPISSAACHPEPFASLEGERSEGSAASRCDSCPLGVCAVGCQATILGISCPAGDAQRLRSLGLFEGARVGIIDTRSGMVLDVRGSRLALGWEIVAGITVCPVSA